MRDLAGAIDDLEQACRLEPKNSGAAAERAAIIEELLGGVDGQVLPLQRQRVEVVLSRGLSEGREAQEEQLLEAATQRISGPMEVGRRQEQTPLVAEVVAVDQWIAAESHPPLLSAETATVFMGLARSGSSTEVAGVAAEKDAGTAGSTAVAAPKVAAAGLPVAREAAAAHWPLTATFKPPRNSVEFEKAWKGLKGDLRQQSQYLMLVQPGQLPNLLKQVRAWVKMEQ